MKKLYFLIFFSIITVSISNGQFTKIGGGFGLTTGYPFHDMSWDYNKSGHFYGLVKGIYEISLPLHISPSFTVFFPHVFKEPNRKVTVSTFMFDINGHYVFNSLDRFEFYGLAGIDVMIARKKEVLTSNSPSPEHDNSLGLNIGTGMYIKITEQLDVYGEVKYVLTGKNKLFFSNYNQFMGNAGLLINLDWLKKNENK